MRATVDLDPGEETWARARRALATWVAQGGAGAAVYPADAPRPGLDVLGTMRLGLIVVVAPCRVVATFDDDDRKGFTYGTLPGHPEQGEESFIVRRRADHVRFEITAFSRPSGLIALASPVARVIQDRVTERYLRSVAAMTARRRPQSP